MNVEIKFYIIIFLLDLYTYTNTQISMCHACMKWGHGLNGPSVFFSPFGVKDIPACMWLVVTFPHCIKEAKNQIERGMTGNGRYIIFFIQQWYIFNSYL